MENTGFVGGYDENPNNPSWVSYHVFKLVSLDSEERPRRFDEDLRTRFRIDHDDYTRSGYDRGRMATNYAIVTRYGPEA